MNETVQIPITKGRTVLIDAADYEKVSRYHWSGNRYASARINGKSMAMHRYIMDAQPGQEIDHINGDIYDNRRSNLRFCTRTENMRNRRRKSDGSSKYLGVGFRPHRGKWRASVQADGECVMRDFDTELDAARWRDAMVRRYYGEFAALNFPNEEPISIELRRPPERRHCGFCGEEFETLHTRAVFCSSDCQKQSYLKRLRDYTATLKAAKIAHRALREKVRSERNQQTQP